MDQKYERIKVLGKGSFGKAYLVKNTEADELCVVKQMETSMMSKKEKEEAVKEALLLKRMDHKNIVRFQEVFMTRKGRLCIVMDYADGGDVHMEIKNRRGELFAEATIIEWFVQICFSLKHVHERKVLHRDLKTQNVFLMSTGQIKLGDFGIAKLLDATKDYAKTMVGTPYYLSPEIIEDQPYNFKSDIWSLGVVLYEMATLKHPFDAESLVILASKILRDDYPPVDPGYSEDLKRLISVMLGKDASSRPVVKEIMARRFLRKPMEDTNARYGLDVNLAEIPCDPPPAVIFQVSSGTIDDEGPVNGEFDGRGENEYDDEFEDYSESDGAEDAPVIEQQRNFGVDRLSSTAPPSFLSTALPSNTGPSTRPSQATNQSHTASSSSAAEVEAIRTKADAESQRLREYLQSQVSEGDFAQAYRLIRSSNASAEELKRQVADIIGVNRAPQLPTLFQFLCYLEDVATGRVQTDTMAS